MKRFPQVLFAGLVVLLSGSVAAQGIALPKNVQLPSETVKLRPSKLAGFGIATQQCAICHSTDYIAYQPPNMNQTQWTAEVAKMHGTYGAPINDGDIKLVGIYLTATYGDAKSVSALDMVSPATGAITAVSVQALLTQNACLSCHAMKQKIVGPAYHDVAVKYQADPQAVSKLESSIRLGGSGKWGAAPMPAFADLSEAQLKALAEFVLTQ